MSTSKFEVPWSTLWRVVFLSFLVIGIFLARESLIVIFLAIIISSAFNGPVSFLQRRKIPRLLGTIFVFLLVLAVLAFLLYILVPLAALELQHVLSSLNKFKIPIFGSLKKAQITEISKYLSDFSSILFSNGGSFFSVVSSIFGGIALIGSTLILSFYLTIDQAGVEKFLRLILPVTHEEYVVNIYLRSRKKLGLWLRGQIILMLIVGAATMLGLLILDVNYALVIGLLAGMLEIVPIVGPVFSGAIAFLIAVSESWTLGLYVALLFVVIQQIESHFLVPIVMKKTVGISPIVVVVALLAGSQIAGFVGIVLAVPAAVVFQEALEDWEKRKMRNQKLEM